eukprot:CAMPEP_0119419182 /NCGR_PEP_ID=MMETSP1335-20130426/20138_1 /TAXON_ID=259385 /ORGANISM="Chrysoculter rhomboideus, Strain RCC1486" /LENGTH=95 /DNA_ID=CAMNT_0007444473 /DNA_START=128 /DNA_END=416 /DNA_ORIENTATION=-
MSSTQPTLPSFELHSRKEAAQLTLDAGKPVVSDWMLALPLAVAHNRKGPGPQCRMRRAISPNAEACSAERVKTAAATGAANGSGGMLIGTISWCH